MVQYFAVFLILSCTGGSLGTTTSPQQQNTANSKDLCKVWKNNTVFFWHFWLISRVVREKKKTLHKKSLLRSIYSRLPVTRTLYIPNLPLTQSNFHFPSNSFLYNFTLDNSNSQGNNSNFFLFLLKVRIIGRRLYLLKNVFLSFSMGDGYR